MTRPFAAIERLLERLFERPAARLFHTSLQPIQVQRKLERAMDTGRVFSGDHVYVPTHYRVRLNPEDARAFDGYRQTLEDELADALHARARARGYRLLARPSVAIEASTRIAVADMDVVSEMVDQNGVGVEHELGPARAPLGRQGTGVLAAGGVNIAPVVSPGWGPQPAMSRASFPAGTPARGSFSGPLPAEALPAAVPGPTDRVPVSMNPPWMAQTPLARIEVRTQGAFVANCDFRGGTARIGRGRDNDIVLRDERVSRRHGQLSARQGNLVFTDLGSTNGSFVNGTRVSEIVLGSGDVVRLGNSTLTIQPHA